MSGHTKGPWESSGTAVYAVEGREIIYGAHNTRGGTEEERKANARLIAAAPELLAACDDAQKFLAYDDDTDGDALRAMIDQARDLLSAAIAKAEGK